MKKAGINAFLIVLLLSFLLSKTAGAQMITGTWKGKINRQKVEVKIIQQGDSLTGTSYYYESSSNYRRYSIRGYFDPNTNEAVWWDDRLLEERSGRFNLSAPGKNAMLSRADFNCPGGGRMMLDGKTARRENEDDIKGEVHLDKTGNPQFEDEWDFVIDNYTVGANDPDIIDSVASIAYHPRTISREPVQQTPPVSMAPAHKPVSTENKPEAAPVDIAPVTKPIMQDEKPAVKPAPVTEKTVAPVPSSAPPAVIPQAPKSPDIVQKFKQREKVFVKDIPVSGDSIELRFYDNAEIDGDSISVFLNDKLLFSHIRLTGNAYTLKLPVADLNASNELTMVAENLGSIPPNTSYMVAIVNGKRYDAYLSSSEGSSAMIKLTKNVP